MRSTETGKQNSQAITIASFSFPKQARKEMSHPHEGVTLPGAAEKHTHDNTSKSVKGTPCLAVVISSPAANTTSSHDSTRVMIPSSDRSRIGEHIRAGRVPPRACPIAQLRAQHSTYKTAESTATREGCKYQKCSKYN